MSLSTIRRLTRTVALAVLLAPASATAAVNPVLAGSVSNSTVLPGIDAVASAGHYAYTADYFAGRLSAVDISVPSSPFVAGSSAASSGLKNGSGVRIAGGYAFVVSKNSNGPKGSGSNDDGTGNSLTILDIHTNPAEPTIVGSVHDPNSLFGAYGIAVSGNYAYVAAQGCVTTNEQPCPNHSVGCDLDVIEISSPSGPKIVATLRNAQEPKAFAHVTSVAISGTYAYLTAAYQQRLTVVNIANPVSPKYITTLYDPTHFPFPVDVAVSGSYAYVVNQAAEGPLAAVDVSNPSAPKYVGSLAAGELDGAYRIQVRGKMAYVSSSTAATVAVVDISNPLALRMLASYKDTAHLFRTTGLDVDGSGRYVVAVSPYTSTQTLTRYPPFALEPGGPELTGTLSVITLDPAPVETTIAAGSGPANPTAQTSASFTFFVSDAVATVQCRLDSGPWLLCTTPTSQSYTGLGAGVHTFQVQATDSAGNTSTAAYTWTINAAPASSTPPSNSGGGDRGPVGDHEALPTEAQIRAALLAALLPGGKASRIASVRRHRGQLLTFDAPARGVVIISWYLLPKGAHLASAKPVLVAGVRAAVTAKGPARLTLELTARGRRLLARGRPVKLTGRAAFTPVGGSKVTVSKPFTLR
jgi:hypothetical protein